ncbi:glycosyltransferase [Shewanella oncorhynchi]|uniref:glycosyltransferase n=1 Tax=Shewanella oncorhynchi TaxID=2726434 RepID=UPI003D7BC4B7
MKKILVLTPRFPYPVIGGDRLRIYNICKALSQHYELTLLSLCESQLEMSFNVEDTVFNSVIRVYLSPLSSYVNCVKALATNTPLQVAYYSNRQFQKQFDKLEKSHDAVLCHLVRTSEYAKYSKIPKVLEMTDAISMNYKRVRTISKRFGFKNVIYSFEQSRIENYEREILNSFDLSVVVSQYDKDFLLCGNSVVEDKLLVCSNGVDLTDLKFNYTPDMKTIVFIGNMTTLQNVDAAKWFIKSVMPLLLIEGDFIFKIIGRINPNQQEEFNSYPNVLATGGVESISKAAEGAFIGVCPMRLGAGVQNKVLEYMAMGIPTITSSVGLEGLEANPGENILVADSEVQYVQIIKSLLDPNLANKFSKKGRAYVEQFHMWNSRLAPFVSKVESLVNL